jgi:hypothetical protein
MLRCIQQAEVIRASRWTYCMNPGASPRYGRYFQLADLPAWEACVRSGSKSNLPSGMILGDPTGSAQRIGAQQVPMQNSRTDEDES